VCALAQAPQRLYKLYKPETTNKTMNANSKVINQTNKKNLLRWIIPAAFVFLVVAWAAFRPELILVNKTVSETLPTTQASGASPAQPIASGMFTSLAHQTTGTAGLYELGDGKKTLRLTDFKTSNGPDVRVYLVASAEGTDNEAIKNGGFVDLGSLKGNIGDQNYVVPDGIDLAKFQGVSIWCKRFAVNFGGAALTPSKTAKK